MFKERRKYPRADIKARVNIICILKVILSGPEVTFRTHTENISEEGIKVILEEELTPGTLVKIQLYLNNEKTMPIECKGQIIWTKKVNPVGTAPDLFVTGIQLIDLNGLNRQLISSLVAAFRDEVVTSKK